MDGILGTNVEAATAAKAIGRERLSGNTIFGGIEGAGGGESLRVWAIMREFAEIAVNGMVKRDASLSLSADPELL